jgi:alpha-tubulin suppressor-like RCC1 family protein
MHMFRSTRPWLVWYLAPSLAIALAACESDAPGPAEPQIPEASLAVAASTLTFTQVAAGWYHTCGVTTDGRAWCWGLNRDGALGDGTTTDRAVPTLVRTTLRFRQISAGTFHSCGLTTESRVVCWGFGGDGQLGTGTTTSRLTPIAVAGDRRFREMRAGYRSSCGVTVSYVAFCWGNNSTGQLGDGTLTRRLKPGRVGGGHSFLRVLTRSDHTCGLDTSAHAWCWGGNTYGQIGDHSTTTRTLPVLLDTSIGRLSQVSTGDQFTCALNVNDVAWCWGRSFHGESGSGFTGAFLSPLRVNSGATRFLGVSPGGGHACAIDTNNLAWCWGTNSFGQLGSAPYADQLSPRPVSGGFRFKAVHSGLVHTCALTSQGQAYCWGSNTWGQLGNGHPGPASTVPVAVAGP